MGEECIEGSMPCHAIMPCYAMPCHAMPCYAMLCYAMLCPGRVPCACVMLSCCHGGGH